MMHVQTQESSRKGLRRFSKYPTQSVLNIHKKTRIAKLEFRNTY